MLEKLVKSSVQNSHLIKRPLSSSHVFFRGMCRDWSPLGEYYPREIEMGTYERWEKAGYFKPSTSGSRNYVIPMPPPNITGNLHLGHALALSLQDSLARWRRMKGDNVLYLPGSDHAGISTQSVVERKLWREENLTRHDIGREEFTEKVLKWKDKYQENIFNQMKQIGVSCDWSRSCFTLDPKFSKAVDRAFIELFDRGIIYRDTKMINWSSHLRSAISNIEVEKLELNGLTRMRVLDHNPDRKYPFGYLAHFNYPIQDGNSQFIPVATTRLETVFGDAAIAVHPMNDKYKSFIGKNAINPLTGKPIPIIADEIAYMNFGTGAVKITPAHDMNDYLVAKRHGLAIVDILNDDGTLNDRCLNFKGLQRFEARKLVFDEMKRLGLFIKSESHQMSLPVCSRTGDILEPRLKPQWYISCKEMASGALSDVLKGNLKIQPQVSKNEWCEWMRNIQDWCISRQIWWGHQIPAYSISDTDGREHYGWVAAASEEEATEKAYKKFPQIKRGDIFVKRDEDVLDTWFSSALWPFASMGWPENTQDFQEYYPASVLETGWDILFFWVAKMVFLGKELTGKVPFERVFCHAMIRDSHGRKMSKSLGNVIEPNDAISGISLEELQLRLKQADFEEKELRKAKRGLTKDFKNGIPACGADALRLTLCSYPVENRDIKLDVNRIAGYRRFCNKVWHSSRFCLSNLGEDYAPEEISAEATVSRHCDKWILSKLNDAIQNVNNSLENHEFMRAASEIHGFWLYDFCDVYIESVKPILRSTESSNHVKSTKNTIYTCLSQYLKLSHPFMPYITDYIYDKLPKGMKTDSPQKSHIMISAYPSWNDNWKYTKEAKEFDSVINLAKRIRSNILSLNLVKKQCAVQISTRSNMVGFFEQQKEILQSLCKKQDLHIEFEISDDLDANQPMNEHIKTIKFIY